MSEPESPAAEVVRLARAWIGTPYHYQGCTPGVGTDCLGLVRGIWRELYGCEAERPPPYTRDWAEVSGRELMLEAAARQLMPVDPVEAAPGDVLVFRLKPGMAAKHAAILATPSTMIHAMENAPVAEVALGPWWRRRLAAVFRFPLAGGAKSPSD